MKQGRRLLLRCGVTLAACLVLAMPVSEARPHGSEAHQKPSQSSKTEQRLPGWPDSIDEGLDIVETQYEFDGPLLPRSWTDTIVIHHVGVPSGEVSAQSIHNSHLGNGWLGIGYHYVIHKDGTIERGRPLMTEGAHAYAHNDHTVGINLTGNFEWEEPTEEQLESLVELLTSLCRIFHLPADDSTIVGHEDLNSTACPGWNLYVLLPEIRNEVRNRLGSNANVERHKAETRILGRAQLKPKDFVRYIKKQNPKPQLSCTVEQLVDYYYEEAEAEGIRPDVALCQAILETNCFAYGGDVVPAQNNYAGLGIEEGNGGYYFATARRGVRAHIQRLLAYASIRAPKSKIVDKGYEKFKKEHPKDFGQTETWRGLNHKWKQPGYRYGDDIIRIYETVAKQAYR